MKNEKNCLFVHIRLSTSIYFDTGNKHGSEHSELLGRIEILFGNKTILSIQKFEEKEKKNRVFTEASVRANVKWIKTKRMFILLCAYIQNWEDKNTSFFKFIIICFNIKLECENPNGDAWNKPLSNRMNVFLAFFNNKQSQLIIISKLGKWVTFYFRLFFVWRNSENSPKYFHCSLKCQHSYKHVLDTRPKYSSFDVNVQCYLDIGYGMWRMPSDTRWKRKKKKRNSTKLCIQNSERSRKLLFRTMLDTPGRQWDLWHGLMNCVPSSGAYCQLIPVLNWNVFRNEIQWWYIQIYIDRNNR